MLIHADKRRYKCTYCDKAFLQRGNLTCHKWIHTGERSTCTDCDQAFALNNHLTNHKRIHTGEKPFMCWVCSIFCAQHHNLLVHIQTKKHQNNVIKFITRKIW